MIIIIDFVTAVFIFRAGSCDNNMYPCFIEKKWHRDISCQGIKNLHPLNPEDVKICGQNKCGRHATAC